MNPLMILKMIKTRREEIADLEALLDRVAPKRDWSMSAEELAAAPGSTSLDTVREIFPGATREDRLRIMDRWTGETYRTVLERGR